MSTGSSTSPRITTRCARGSTADKSLPGGKSEEEFVGKYGFGVSTLYTGQPPQLVRGVQSREGSAWASGTCKSIKPCSSASRVAYNRTLFGENTDAAFAVALDRENFSRTGGCTRKAIEQVFQPEQLKTTYYNPKDAIVNKDPRMKDALRRYARAKCARPVSNTIIRMRSSPMFGSDLPPSRRAGRSRSKRCRLNNEAPSRHCRTMSERRPRKTFGSTKDIFEPVEEKILEEMFARKPQ